MTPDEAEAVARLITAQAGSGLGPALDDLARLTAGFDMSCAFAYGPGGTARLIHDGYSAAVNRSALGRYMKGGFLLDPFYVACTTGLPEGLWRMRDIAPDGFFASDFASSHEVHPCISREAGTLVEEIGFVVPLGDGEGAVYSLMRHRDGLAFSADEFRALAVLGPLVAACLRANPAPGPALAAGPDSPPAAQVDNERAFETAFGDRLTPTQLSVTRLVLRGHSNLSIATQLGITEGTAKLHRHNIYRRLEISSQSELFQLFIKRI